LVLAAALVLRHTSLDADDSLTLVEHIVARFVDVSATVSSMDHRFAHLLNGQNGLMLRNIAILSNAMLLRQCFFR